MIGGAGLRALSSRVALAGALGGALFALAHCGSSADAGGAVPFGSGGLASDAAASGGSGAYAAGGAGGSALPPEKELEGSYRAPVTTGKYVWSANPDSGRVALIDATNLQVHTVEAGFGPTYLAAIPGQKGATANTAIVLNVLGHDATLLRVQPDSSIATKTLPTHESANAWSIGPAGHWAIAWSDARKVKNPDPTQGFQDITVIRLDSGKEASTELSVGYRPTSVRFDASGTHAYAVTDPGISVVSLDGAAPQVTDLVQVTDNPADNPASRDVTITPNGKLALVRRDGSPDVGVVTLSTGQRTTITLSGNVTDLDLSQDGTRAVAVVRSASEVDVLPIPDIVTSSFYPSVKIDGEEFGSVSLSPDGNVALLYENAVDNDHVTILSLDSQSYLDHRTVALKAPVQAVFVAPDGENALALQSTPAGSTKAGAFSVIPTTVVRAPRIEGTDAPPTAVAVAPPPSSRALVTVRDDQRKQFGVYVVRMPSLQVDYLPLASPPIATGMVPAAGKGYVAQLNPDGRITFIDLTDGSARTLTGFELAAKVVN
jgi:hypothetical protein